MRLWAMKKQTQFKANFFKGQNERKIACRKIWPHPKKLRAYPNNRVVMRPSENLSPYGGVRGQGGRPKMPGRRQASLGGVVCSTLRTFLADNTGIGLPLGIERVIWIGS